MLDEGGLLAAALHIAAAILEDEGKTPKLAQSIVSTSISTPVLLLMLLTFLNASLALRATPSLQLRSFRKAMMSSTSLDGMAVPYSSEQHLQTTLMMSALSALLAQACSILWAIASPKMAMAASLMTE